MAKSVTWKKDAVRSLSRMQPKRAAMIREAILGFAFGKPSDVLPLAGQTVRYRLRCGDWRALMDVFDDHIVVRDVVPRGQANAKAMRSK